MNNKQLLVAWVSAILIVVTLICFPKKYVVDYGAVGRFYVTKSHYLFKKSKPEIQWGYVLSICISTALLGGLLIFTLKDKK